MWKLSKDFNTVHWFEKSSGHCPCSCGNWSDPGESGLKDLVGQVPPDRAADGRCFYLRSGTPLELVGVRKAATAGALLSPDAPVIVNATGGKQSDVGVRTDLVPPKALLHVAAILKYGADKYGENNWHKIAAKEHLNHALTHIFAYLDGNTEDDHLGHACCRLQMALEMELRGGVK